jgi:hypothetical protein
MSGISTDGIKAKMTENVNTYMMNTHYLNDYNEIYNVNNYLDERTTLEKERLVNVLDRLNSTLLRFKQEYLLKAFDVQSYSTKINILIFVLIVVCILIILVILFSEGKMGKKLLSLILGSVIVVGILIVWLIAKSNSYRERTNWDMYYWGPVEKKS